jgi:hypothetical protein
VGKQKWSFREPQRPAAEVPEVLEGLEATLISTTKTHEKIRKRSHKKR